VLENREIGEDLRPPIPPTITQGAYGIGAALDQRAVDLMLVVPRKSL